MLLKNIIKYEYFIEQLVSYDLKIKYKSSFIGIFWSLLEPLSRFFTMLIIFSFIFRSVIEDYPLFLFSGLVVWNFFENCSVKNVNRLIEYANLIKKVNFPKELIIISGVISSTISFLIESLIVAVLIIVYNKFNFFTIIFYLPAVLLLIVLNTGIGLLLSSTNVIMRDVQFIWRTILQAMIFATPIFYKVDLFPDWAKFVITLNPLTGIINYIRDVVIYEASFPASFFYSIIASVLIFVVGDLVFNHYQKRFAEVL